MQTFLPYGDFVQSAVALDTKRLGKQRVEGYQILRILLGKTESKAWRGHPAVKMWEGHEGTLSEYVITVCNTWILHGYKDTVKEKIISLIQESNLQKESYRVPSFIGDKEFHLSHQSNLIRKKPDFYRKIFGDTIPDNLPYVWPKGRHYD